MYCAADNYNKMCHTCAKEFLNSNFNSFWQNINFYELPQIPHIHINHNYSSIYATF